MVQVAGPQGQPAYVYRPWTAEDLLTAAKHLPKSERGGATMAKAVHELVRDFTPTSSEMARVMINLMSPAQFALIRDCFSEHRQPTLPDWPTDTTEGSANKAYKVWLDTLTAAITEKFQTACDLSKVSVCVQKEGETCEDYLIRLQAIFEDYSGATRPTEYPGNVMTTYEALLKNSFLEGMHSSLSEATKRCCVGWKDSSVRLADVLRHARHVQEQENDKNAKTDRQQKDSVHRAQLRLLQHVAPVTPPTPHPAPVPPPPHNQTVICFYCGGTGHWAHTCPIKISQKRGRGRGRGRGKGNSSLGHDHGGYQGPPSLLRLRGKARWNSGWVIGSGLCPRCR